VMHELGHFTCIVGANGTGKSVVGEAVAFALGGNARMMRAKSLGLLLHQASSRGGVDVEGGGSAPQAVVEVRAWACRQLQVNRYL
jgi:hypothetical protein